MPLSRPISRVWCKWDVRCCAFSHPGLTLGDTASSIQSAITPFKNVVDVEKTDAATRAKWSKKGLAMISEGKAAALLMAGGQVRCLPYSDFPGSSVFRVLVSDPTCRKDNTTLVYPRISHCFRFRRRGS